MLSNLVLAAALDGAAIINALRPYWPVIAALVVWPVVTGVLNWYLWWDTPANWQEFARRAPRLAFLVRLNRAWGPHLRKLVVAWRDLAAARSSLPMPAPDAPTRADELVIDVAARPTVAPEPIAPRDGERGHVDPRALLLLAVGFAVVLPLGAALMGCPASRQLTRPALGPVDGCEPRATRCAPDGRPQVCSGSGRWTDADVVCATAVQVSAVCCLTTSPITGAELHACVLPERCIGEVGR